MTVKFKCQFRLLRINPPSEFQEKEKMDRANEKRSKLLELKTKWMEKTEQLKLNVMNYESYNFFINSNSDENDDKAAKLLAVKKSISDKKYEKDNCEKVKEAKKREQYENEVKANDEIHYKHLETYKNHHPQHLKMSLKNWSNDHKTEVEMSKQKIAIEDFCVPAKNDNFEMYCKIGKAFNSEDVIFDLDFYTKMKIKNKSMKEKNELETLFG